MTDKPKGEELFQSRPTDTNSASVLSPDANEVVHITNIMFCNTTGVAATYTVHKDEDGSTYDADTQIFCGVSLPGNTTDSIDVDIWMRNPSGNMAVKQGTAGSVNFTGHGERYQK